MKDSEHVYFPEGEPFDNRDLAPVEEIMIGATPQGFTSIGEFSEVARNYPSRVLTPFSLFTGEKDVNRVITARRKRGTISAPAFFPSDITVELIKRGLLPSVHLAEVDKRGVITKVQVAAKNQLTGDKAELSDDDLKRYLPHIRSVLKPVLLPHRIEDGSLIYIPVYSKGEADADK